MDQFIKEFNQIVREVDAETLDLIVFPQFSKELDQIGMKDQMLQRCVEMVESTKSPQKLQNLLEFMVNLTHKNNLWIKNLKNIEFLEAITNVSSQLIISSMHQKLISKRILTIANGLLTQDSDSDSDENPLNPQEIQKLQKLIEFHKNALKPPVISDLARDLRGGQNSCIEEDFMILESINLQMAQQRTINQQIDHFIKGTCQKSFIRICQSIKFPQEGDILDKEKTKLIVKILDTLIPQTHFLMENGQVYVDTYYYEILTKKWKKLYHSFANGINCLLTRSKSFKIQLSVLKLLKRFYFDINPSDDIKSFLEQTFITNLESISEIPNVSKHKEAALIFYKFKGKIQSSENLEILKFNPFYSGYFSVHLVENKYSGLKQIDTIGGFVCEIEIQPKSYFTEVIDVKQDKSLLFVSFNTLNYNMGFSITNMEDKKQVLKYCIYDSHFSPIQRQIVVDRGVYEVKWHNEYSFINKKVLRYKIRLISLQKNKGQKFDIQWLVNQYLKPRNIQNEIRIYNKLAEMPIFKFVRKQPNGFPPSKNNMKVVIFEKMIEIQFQGQKQQIEIEEEFENVNLKIFQHSQGYKVCDKIIVINQFYEKRGYRGQGENHPHQLDFMKKMQKIEKMLYYGLHNCQLSVSLSCISTYFYFIDLADYLYISEPDFDIKAFILPEGLLLLDLTNNLEKTIDFEPEIVKSIYGAEVQEIQLKETEMLDNIYQMASENEEKWLKKEKWKIAQEYMKSDDEIINQI